MRLALTFNLRRPAGLSRLQRQLQAEWDAPETIGALHQALSLHHEVERIEADLEAFEHLRRRRPQFVFNVAEGAHGLSRESQVPTFCEMLQLPYSGSDPLSLALCLDKLRAKEVLLANHLPVPRGVVASHPSQARRASQLVGLPAIVKPLREGSSMGIPDGAVVESSNALERQLAHLFELIQGPALVEEYLPGREFTIAVLGNGPRTQVLPIVELCFECLPPGARAIHSFEAKWEWDTPQHPLPIFQCPAPLEDGLREQLERLALQSYRVMRCRDWCRIDLRCDARGQPFLVELNPLPGVLPRPEENSCFPKAARAAGLSYDELINRVLDAALERYGLTYESSPDRDRLRLLF